jgi:hypothetical protein
MIAERKALTLHADGADCVVTFEGSDAPALGTPLLLLDASGRLVGVDLGGGGFGRVVVLFGPIEAVTEQREARVSVAAGSMRIHGGAALVAYR